MIKLFETYVEIKDLVFLTWYGDRRPNISINDVYLQQNGSHLYKDYVHFSIQNYSRPMTEKEKEKYIYNNKLPISIYDRRVAVFLNVYYDELIKIIEKDNLIEKEKELKRLKNIEKYKDVDPYGEEDWDVNEGYEYDNSGEYTKLIPIVNDVIDRSEIDPYGEEDWDDNKIDWNKIKIVHPDKEMIGKKVLIQPKSCYYCDDMSNPKDTIGTIDDIYNYDSHDFGVRWNNGFHNAYRREDLTIIEI